MNTKHQTETPNPTQLFIGMGMAFLSAKDHVDASAVLLAGNRRKRAYSEWLFAIEELGKVILYWRCVHPDEERRASAWASNRIAIEDHKEKILVFANCLQYLLELKSDAFSLRFSFKADDPKHDRALGAFLSSLKKAQNNAGLPSWLHFIRESSMYATINNGRVSSPECILGEIPEGFLDAVIGLTTNTLKAADLLFTEVFGPIYRSLQNHSNSRKSQEAQTYSTLEKTLGRFFPSFAETVSRFTSGEYSIKDCPEYSRIAKELKGNAGAKFIVMAYMLKKCIELSASEETLKPLALTVPPPQSPFLTV